MHYVVAKNDRTDHLHPQASQDMLENARKSGHSNKRFCGWAREGLEQMNKNYMTTVEGRKDIQGFDHDLLVHFVTIMETEDARRNKPQHKIQHDEMEGFQLLNSLPEDGVVAQRALEEDLEEDGFSD